MAGRTGTDVACRLRLGAVLGVVGSVLFGGPALACESVQSVADFRSQLDATWEAIDGQPVSRISDRYRRAIVASEAAIACLEGPIEPEDAARLHRNRALASMLAGDSEGARAATSAALRLDAEAADAWSTQSPDFATLRDEVEAAAMTLEGREEFPTSLASSVWSDGEPLAARTVGQPVVVQVFDVDDRPIGGAWIDAREPMPDWVVYPPVDCGGASVAVSELVQQVQRAEEAFEALDLDGFETALERIATGLPCVDQAIRPTQAAAIHRLEGLRQYTRGQRLGSIRSFQEAQTLDAAFEPPEALTREGSTLAALWSRASTATATPWIPLAPPEGLGLRVDGLETTARPATQPFIVQAVAPSGQVLWTRYIPGGVPLPDLGFLLNEAMRVEENRLPPALATYRAYGREQQRSRSARVLQFGGAVALVGAGLLYGLNARQVNDYKDPTTPPDRIESLRVAANQTATGSLALGVVGVVGIGASFAF
jgi:hypothetical protein